MPCQQVTIPGPQPPTEQPPSNGGGTGDGQAGLGISNRTLLGLAVAGGAIAFAVSRDSN